ncbi:hypothetical protein KC333_g223 [Hortaea werneckii]|nr:hypothetical protein KC333_g223 [Hortaea werneckii]
MPPLTQSSASATQTQTLTEATDRARAYKKQLVIWITSRRVSCASATTKNVLSSNHQPRDDGQTIAMPVTN